MTNEPHKNFAKYVNEEIECTNKIRYIVLMKIMFFFLKYVRKKMMKLLRKIKIKIKIRNRDDYINR